MNPRMTCRRVQNGVGFLFIVTCLTSTLAAQERKDDSGTRLTHVQTVTLPSLESVTSVEVSNDGRFLYASAWLAPSLTVFNRDAKTGMLESVQTVEHEGLDGSVAVRFTPDNRFGVSTAFRAKTALLWKRDPMDGRLRKMDDAVPGVRGVEGFDWIIDCCFSNDSKYVFVIDAGETNVEGRLYTFRIKDRGTLEFVHSTSGDINSLANPRGVTIHPNGKMIYCASSSNGRLVVIDVDQESGTTKISQVLSDFENRIDGLDGVFGVACSPDGAHLYTSSGRFEGDQAVCVFGINDGKLEPIQQFVVGSSELTGFEGGNEITVTPDGRSVYAVGTVSGSIACFDRDPKTGRLIYVETISEPIDAVSGAAGINTSADGRFVYVASENTQSVSVFQRNIP